MRAESGEAPAVIAREARKNVAKLWDSIDVSGVEERLAKAQNGAFKAGVNSVELEVRGTPIAAARKGKNSPHKSAKLERRQTKRAKTPPSECKARGGPANCRYHRVVLVGAEGNAKKLGFPSFEVLQVNGHSKQVNVKRSIQKLTQGCHARSPLGNTVFFGGKATEHWYDRKKTPADIKTRLKSLPTALETVNSPNEIWKDGEKGVIYLRKIIHGSEEKASIVFTNPAHTEMTTYLPPIDEWNWVNSKRKGKLIYVSKNRKGKK